VIAVLKQDNQILSENMKFSLTIQFLLIFSIIFGVTSFKANSTTIRQPLKALKLHKTLMINDNELKSIATGLIEILKVFFINKMIHFEILIIGDAPKRQLDIVNFIWQQMNGNIFQYRVRNVKLSYHYLINRSALIFVEAKQADSFILTSYLMNKWHTDMKFFIYNDGGKLPRALIEDSLKNKSRPFEKLISVIQQSKTLNILAPYWFRTCDSSSYRVVNSFNLKSLQWRNQLQVTNNFDNWQQCPLITYPFHETVLDRKGFDYLEKIMHVVGKVHNFTPMFVHNASNEHFVLFKTIYFATPYVVVSPFDMDLLQLLLSDPEVYSSYEKLLFPFDRTTWGLFIGTFVIAFAVISVVKRMSMNWQNLVFGNDVKSPSLNVLRVFFGLGQLRLPTASFARFILMMFILFCLIFRTAYQGVFYEMMTTNMKKPLPSSIEDMLESNYTMRMTPDEHSKIFMSKYNETCAG
jgi:hypothetical protein